jgi:hypothetical protein
LAAAAVLAGFVATSARANACTPVGPPFELAGHPTAGEVNIPTNAIPIYGLVNARINGEQSLPLTAIEMVSAAGMSVPVAPRVAFDHLFELVPEAALEPSTTYTIRVTPPPPTTGEPYGTAELSFTTGAGPVTTPPMPPDVRVQHYVASEALGSTCDPGTEGSCLSFPPGSGVEVWNADTPQYRYLIFGSWWAYLRTTYPAPATSCAILRARAPDGAMSDTIEVCGDDGEFLSIPDNAGIRCTNRGFEKGGVPLGGSGGTGTGGSAGMATGGTATGGAETGGATSGGTDAGATSTGGFDTGGSNTGGADVGGTGGTGNSAGAPDEEDDGSHTVMTEGCGCRVPAPTGGAHPACLLAAAASLLLLRRRRV